MTEEEEIQNQIKIWSDYRISGEIPRIGECLAKSKLLNFSVMHFRRRN